MRGCRLYLEPVVVDVEGGVVGLGSSVSKTGGADFTVFVFLSQDLFVFHDLTLFNCQWNFRTKSAHFARRRTMVTLFLSALGSTSPWGGEDSKLPSEWKLPLMRPANVSAWKSINIYCNTAWQFLLWRCLQVKPFLKKISPYLDPDCRWWTAGRAD